MAQRNEEYARLKPGGGYTQALTVGKGFSSAERSNVKQRGGRSGHGGGEGRGSSGGSGGTMNAFAQHQQLIRNYHRYNLNAKVPSSGAIEAKGLPGQRRLTDEEALRRQHRFVRDSEEDHRAHQARGLEGAEADPSAWEVRMAAKYYKLLFKEYALADLSRYREDKVGLRWRTEKDVVSGKGQFECGALRCQERKDLHSYELNFKYKEAEEIKNELVKVRVCPQCARKLFRKKIEALQRQREAQALAAEQEEAADSERRRKTGKTASSPVPSHGSASGSANAATRHPAGPSDAAGRIGRQANGDSLGGHVDAGEGHDLVLEAVGGSEGGGANGQAVARKRSRPSRWGDRIAPPEGIEAQAARDTAEGATGPEGTDGASGGGPAPVSGGAAAIGGEAARKAWAGELERDRTAEDEMDDYLSSLLL